MSFEKKCLVSPSDLDALIQKNEQSLSENNIITKAAQEGAKGEAILNYNLPDGLKEKDLNDLSSGPLLNLVKKLVKKEPVTPSSVASSLQLSPITPPSSVVKPSTSSLKKPINSSSNWQAFISHLPPL